MDWTTLVALISLIFPSSDATCGSSQDQFPCLPEFPDWEALFPKTIAALGTSQAAQLKNEAVTLAQEKNVSISFCIEKLNVSEVNVRLDTSNPVDIDAICRPTTSTTLNPITTFTTRSGRVSTHTVAILTSPSPSPSIKQLDTTIVDRVPSPTTTSSTTATSVGRSSTLISTLTSINAIPTVSSKTSSHVTIIDVISLAPSSSASISVPPQEETPRAGQEIVTGSGSKEEASARAAVITTVVCTLVIVPIVLIAAILIFCSACRYRRNRHGSPSTSSSCVDILLCRFGKTGHADVTTTTVTSVSPDKNIATTNKQPPALKRNFSEYSTNSATQLIGRSDSRISGDISPIGSPEGVGPYTTPGLVMRPSVRTLPTVDESIEPGSTERRTDPLHRRSVQPVDEADWQRTLPTMNHHRRAARRQSPPDAAAAARSTVSEDFLNRIDYGYQTDNKVHITPFPIDRPSGSATGNGIKPSENIPGIEDDDDDDDQDNDMKAIWEKFDDAENMAIEVELGSHQAIVGAGLFPHAMDASVRFPSS